MFLLIKIAGVLVLCFNLFTIWKIYKAVINEKWWRYVLLLFFNIPTLFLSVDAGFDWKLINIDQPGTSQTMVQDEKLQCKEVLIESLKGLYKKNAIEIDHGAIYFVDFEEKFKMNFEGSPFFEIDNQNIQIVEYGSGSKYVSLFFQCNEINKSIDFIVNFKSRISSGRRFSGEIQLKYVDSSWEIRDINMVSAIE